MYESQTCYIVGESKSPGNNAITKKYDSFFVGFVVDMNSNEIVDVECTAMLDITVHFVHSLFVGKKMTDGETVEQEITTRYFGSSKKALSVAFKQAQLKYYDIMNI
ncbi:DUF3870 domain-containing protein [Salimicrobium salexigens]|uniref:DUF3870 domain-containing protein n=1 Tax=Salimicrobium salexigens TaxID=908941 RepID=A0ABY1KSM9_9BACI|nr:DUF3870 domain-containing protein [Salimicrobium salexigens]SIS72114.1 protein of unknown function [Salimicrobium salexigens]